MRCALAEFVSKNPFRKGWSSRGLYSRLDCYSMPNVCSEWMFCGVWNMFYATWGDPRETQQIEKAIARTLLFEWLLGRMQMNTCWSVGFWVVDGGLKGELIQYEFRKKVQYKETCLTYFYLYLVYVYFYSVCKNINTWVKNNLLKITYKAFRFSNWSSAANFSHKILPTTYPILCYR